MMIHIASTLAILAVTTLLTGHPIVYDPYRRETEPYTETKFPPELVKRCRQDWLHCNTSVLFDGYHLTPEQDMIAQGWIKDYKASLSAPWDHYLEVERGEGLEQCFRSKYFDYYYRLFGCFANLLVDDRLGPYPNANQSVMIQQAIGHLNFVRDHPIIQLNTTTNASTTIQSSPSNPQMFQRCPPLEPMIDLWYAGKPSPAQQAFCFRNPSRCPMSMTLFGLNLNQNFVDTFQTWLDYYNQNDPCQNGDDDDDEDYEADPPGIDYRLLRTMELFNCIKGEISQKYSLLPCLHRLLKNNHIKFEPGRQSGAQTEVINVHEWIKSHPAEKFDNSTSPDEDYAFDYGQ